ncbi:hypothetical protein JHK85_016323 [Glycine max]|nr:hypothetical protein JHK85_016323 [Glycine max]
MEGSVAVSNENSHLEQSENMEQDVGEMEKDKGLNKAFDMERNGEGGNINNAKATNETREIESDKDLAAQSAFIHEEFIGKQKVSKESVADQDIGLMRTECKVEEKKLKEIGVEKQQANEKIRAPEMTAGDAEHSGTQTEKEGDTVTKADYRGIEAAGPAAVQETVNVQKTAQWFHVERHSQKQTYTYKTGTEIVQVLGGVVGGLPPFPNVTHSSLSFTSPLFSLYPIPITQICFLALDAMWTGAASGQLQGVSCFVI